MYAFPNEIYSFCYEYVLCILPKTLDFVGDRTIVHGYKILDIVVMYGFKLFSPRIRKHNFQSKI